MATFILQFDGICEPVNPGGLAIGAWIGFLKTEPNRPLFMEAKCFFRGTEQATNHGADWCALGAGLREILDLAIIARFAVDKLQIEGDSQIAIMQLTGGWACRNERLQKYRARCAELIVQLAAPYTAVLVDKIRNAAANKLAHQHYEQLTGEKIPERSRK